MFHSFTLLLTAHRNNISYIRCFSKLLYQLNKRYQFYFIKTMHKINMLPQNVGQAEEVLKKGLETSEEDFA